VSIWWIQMQHSSSLPVWQYGTS